MAGATSREMSHRGSRVVSIFVAAGLVTSLVLLFRLPGNAAQKAASPTLQADPALEARLAAIEKRLAALEAQASGGRTKAASEEDESGPATGEVVDKVSGVKLPSIQLKANHVCGYVLNSAGKPIGERIGTIEVEAYDSSARGLRDVTLRVSPDEKGYFELRLAEGLYRFSAKITIMRDEQKLVLPLRPVQVSNATREGRKAWRQDFIWSISGQVPGTAGDPKKGYEHYGIHLEMNLHDYGATKATGAPKGTKYAFGLAPRGPMLDGSQAKPRVIEWKLDNPYNKIYINDLPVGEWTLGGVCTSPDGTKKQLWFANSLKNQDTWYRRLPVPLESGDYGRASLKTGFIRITDADLKEDQ